MPEAATPEQLVDAFKQIAARGAGNWDLQSAQNIVIGLKASPRGVDPLLDIVGDPQADKLAKVLAVICLSPEITPEMAPRLTEFTQPDKDATTRACATHLLGLVKTPEADARMQALIGDPEHTVRSAAILVLGAFRNDPAALAELPALWQDAETTNDDRNQILNMVSEEQVREHQELFKDALANQDLNIKARERLATVLGMVGDEAVLEVLDKVAAEDPHDSVKVMARGAADAIRARLNGTAPAAQEGAPLPAPAGDAPDPAPQTPLDAPTPASTQP